MKTQDTEIPSKIVEPASLKEARRRLGKTQAQIATEIGLKNYQSIVQIESGQRPIPAGRVTSFAEAYGVPVVQLKKLWVRKSYLKQYFNQQLKTGNNMDVLPIIKAVAECDIPRITLSEFSRLLDYTSLFQRCTPTLIKEILVCGFE